ncbi:hypothetical protein [Caldicellulosiruptor morganii]|uniref:Uncharacterized protein n=1 Tax=Caldicellulosiruptor morganii TaxID=1387555 RepID=A0ABY7BQI9_9FIRM|nr:hypothetical protein [Caldicellulosiruptor morganii]WAM33801.1 hypothetical protein OTK00_002344 [Caldicellulosiruptor morganii]
MKILETNAMRELHKIQEEIYEETKYMTVTELIRYFKENAKEVEKKLEELREKNRKEIVQ